MEAGEWRLTFWLILAVLAIGAFGLPSEPRREGERVDTTGATTSIAGVALLLGGAVQAAAWGWGSPATIAVLAAGVALLALFVVVQLRLAQPLLDLALLRDRRLAGAAGGLFFVQFGTNGFAIFVPIYLLTIVGLDPLITGVALLAALIFPPIMSPIGGALADRIGARSLAIGGAALAGAGLAWMALSVGEKEYAIIVPGSSCSGSASRSRSPPCSPPAPGRRRRRSAVQPRAC